MSKRMTRSPPLSRMLFDGPARVAHLHGRAEAGAASGFDHAGPERRLGLVGDEEFERAVVGEHARGDHAGVVEHGEVAGAQVRGEDP